MALSGSLNFLSASITGSNNINVDFVGLNTLIVDPMSRSSNQLGHEFTSDSSLYYNNSVDAQGGIQATATVTITDLTEINNGDKVNLIATDTTSHDFTAGSIAGAGTWVAETNNNTTATNLAAQINANAKFTASAASAVVTITQATVGTTGPDGNTTITLTDSGAAGMSKTDFTGGTNNSIQPNQLNSLLLNRNGPYQHPSWKQYRGGEHPVARKLRLNNTMSIDATFADSIAREQQKKQLRDKLENDIHEDVNKHFESLNTSLRDASTSNPKLYQQPSLQQYYEPSVLKAQKPFIYDVLPGNFRVRSTLMNQMVFFENKEINQALNIAGTDRYTSSFSGVPTKRPKQEYYNLITAAKDHGAHGFIYSETIFPKSINAFRPYKLQKLSYEETSGTGANGYDRAVNRSFWRDSQPSLSSSISSDGTSRLRTNSVALNSQDVIQTITNLSASNYEGYYNLLPPGGGGRSGGAPLEWNHTYYFMEPGIIVHHGTDTTTGSVGADGLPTVDVESSGAFVTLESYQPHPISLLSMWPLDPRPDIYSSPIYPYLTSSHGGKGLQIGLTPHRMKEAVSLIDGSTGASTIYYFQTISPVFDKVTKMTPEETPVHVYGPSTGDYDGAYPNRLYQVLPNATASYGQIQNLMTGAAGELVYSTKPTMFFHKTGSEDNDILGYHAQTASLQYNRHTFPYNTPFYATNKVRGRNPFYNSYSDFAQDMKLIGRDYSYVPEYKTADSLKYYYERYFKGKLDDKLHTEISLTKDFDQKKSYDSFYDSQAGTEALGSGGSVSTLSAAKIIKRNVEFPTSRHPKDFKLNFLTIDGAFVTASADVENFSGSSESPTAFKYVSLTKTTEVSTLKDQLGYSDTKIAISHLQNSSGTIFNEAFSHTDTGEMSNLLAKPLNKTFDTIPRRITFTAHGLKKLRPEKNFYPVTKTVDVGNKFKQFIYNNLQEGLVPEHGDGQTNDRIEQEGQKNGQLQSFLEPFFAPGILYNSIKSGIAVDYPVYSKKPTYFAPWMFFSGSLNATNIISKNAADYGSVSTTDRFSISITSSFNYGGFYMLGASRSIPAILNSAPDFRMPFEALYNTSILKKKFSLQSAASAEKIYLTTDFLDLDINYPEGTATTGSAADHAGNAAEHPGAAYTYTGPHGQLRSVDDNNTDQFLYESSVNNFLCETMNFFLKDQDGMSGLKLPVIVSDYRKDNNINLEADNSYAMEVSLEMGKHQVLCEGPRNAGVGGGSSVNNDYANDNLDASMRGYLYGPPVEIVRMTGSVTTTVTETYNESTGLIERADPAIASDLKSDGTFSGNGDYESYFAANLQDPAYQTYTPPYFYGKSSIVVAAQSTSDITTWDNMFKETDNSSYYLESYVTGTVQDSLCVGLPASGSTSGLYSTRMKLNSSVDVFNRAKINYVRPDMDIAASAWYVNPKWVCPVLDFSSSYTAVTNKERQGLLQEQKETISFVTNSFHDTTTGRGLWGGYGSDPYDNIVQKEIEALDNMPSLSINKGLFLKISDLPNNKFYKVNLSTYKTDLGVPSSGYFINKTTTSESEATGALSQTLGFHGAAKTIGEMADSKTISEALVVIPYFDKPVQLRGDESVPSGELFVTREIIPGKYFLPIHKMLFENLLSMALAKRKYGVDELIGEFTSEIPGVALVHGKVNTLTRRDHLGFESSHSYTSATTTDAFRMIETILGDEEKGIPGYELPVELDFINYRQSHFSEKSNRFGPFQMIVIPFEHELSKQELIDIYQGIMPETSLSFEKAVASFSLNLSPNNRHTWMPKTKGFKSVGTAPGKSLQSINPANFLDPSYLYCDKELRNHALPGDKSSEWIKTSRDFYKNLKFMTFKIKQRGIKDYQNYKNRQIERAVLERTKLRLPDIKKEELGLGFNTDKTLRDVLGYNWPYDDFSLMEAFKLDIQVEIEE
jgi:hypothetical protein